MDRQVLQVAKPLGPDTDSPTGTVRILQITDTHLYADPARELLGINTLDSLRQVLAMVEDGNWQYDLVLATGDLVHDASAAGYRHLARELSTLQKPVYCLPGNHDKPEPMKEQLESQGLSMDPIVNAGYWRLVLLDSVIPGEEGGRLEASELRHLEKALAAGDRNVLVSLHHQPVPIGSAWIDTMALENADAFFDIIDAHDNVKAIVWGHVHQDFDQQRNNVRLLAAPSTCIQFTPRSKRFALDVAAPGCRLLTLRPNGEIQTEVLRLQSVPEGLDLVSAGY